MRSNWFTIHHQRDVTEVLAARTLEKVQHVLLQDLLCKIQQKVTSVKFMVKQLQVTRRVLTANLDASTCTDCLLEEGHSPTKIERKISL